MKISVQQGQIFVNSIDCLHKGENSYVLSVDLKAKYAEIWGTLTHEHSSDPIEVLYSAGTHTLHKEDSDDLTVIQIELNGDWCVDATCGRYTSRIYLYKSQSVENVWSTNPP